MLQDDKSRQQFSSVEEVRTNYDALKDFTSLDAWKKTRSVRLYFYDEVLPMLPAEEKYILGTQIRRASISATANIAEGYGRFHFQEGIQFYHIARGSLYELKDHLICCRDLHSINQTMHDKGLTLIEDAKVTLSGYIRFVTSQQKTGRRKHDDQTRSHEQG